jgi:hypothetical protein
MKVPLTLLKNELHTLIPTEGGTPEMGSPPHKFSPPFINGTPIKR